MHYQVHELTSLIPEIDGRTYLELKADIAKNGQIEPIVLWEGKVIDGRARQQACADLGKEPSYREFHVNGIDALTLIIANNVRRRHLTEGQRAAIAVKLKDAMLWKKPDPKSPIGGKSLPQVAAIMGVGTGTVSRANVVARRNPTLFKEMANGRIKVSAAYKKVSKRKHRLAIFSDGGAHERIMELGLEGWSFEARRVNSLWLTHFFGHDVRPMSGDGWAKLEGAKAFWISVDAAARQIEHYAYA